MKRRKVFKNRLFVAFTILWAVTMLILFCDFIKNNSKEKDYTDNISQNNIQKMLQAAESNVKLYYDSLYSWDLNVPVFDMPTSDVFNKYIADKYNYEKALLKENKVERLVEIATTVENYEIIDNNMVCYVVVKLFYKYKDDDSISSLTKSVQVVFNFSGRLNLVDWYENDPSSFDSQLRGYGLDLCNKENLLERSNATI